MEIAVISPSTHKSWSARFLVTGIVPMVLAMASAHADSNILRVDDVVTSVAGRTQALVAAPGTVSIITREDLEQQQVTSLNDALRGIEGLNLFPLDARSGKTGNQTLSIRGLPGEYTLVLIDGVRQNVSGTVAPNAFVDSAAAFIPPVAAIERIEVIRGPMSTLYGSDAIAGVVNIITRQPRDSWEGATSLSHTFQSDSRFGGRSIVEGYLAGPLNDPRLSARLQLRLDERAESQLDIPGTEPSLIDNRTMGQNPVAADFQTIGGRLAFAPVSEHEFSLRFDITRQTYNNDRGQLGRFGGTEQQPDFTRGYSDELGFNRRQLTLAHEANLAIGDWSTSLTRDFVETTGRTINAGAVPDTEQWGQPRTLELRTHLLDSRLAVYAGDHTLVVGTQYLDPELDNGFSPERFGGRQISAYLEDEWQMTPDLALTAGIRYDDNENFGSVWTQRGYLVWTPNAAWTIKGGVGRAFRAPFLEQIHDGIIGFGDGGSRPLFGNPDLRSETGTNHELSFLYQGEAGLALSATLFHSELRNKIERGTGANEGIDVNIGSTRIRGIELAARRDLGESVRLSGNYSWTDSEVLAGGTSASEVGDPLFSTPEHMAHLRLDWCPVERFNAFVLGEYRGSAWRARDFHEPQDGGSAQGAFEALGEFHGYTLLSLGGSWAFNPATRLNATIENLLDRDFIDYRPYPGRNDPEQTYFSNVYSTIREPRRLWVSLQVEF